MLGAPWHVPSLDRERSALARDHRGFTQQLRNRDAVERGGHHEQPQLWPEHGLRLQRERETEVCVETALVELVEDHEADSFERRILVQHACEYALRDDLDAGACADPRLTTHAESNRGTDRFAERDGHASCCGASGETPWLEHHDALEREPGFVQQRERHTSRLARARWRLKHHVRPMSERRAKRGQHVVDRQAGQGRGATRHPRNLALCDPSQSNFSVTGTTPAATGGSVAHC